MLDSDRIETPSTGANRMTDQLQSLQDRVLIIEVMSLYATGLDARDWKLWRSIFLDQVVFDLSSWNGQEPRLVDTDRVVAAQARIFAELAATQHFMTNHRVTVEGDTARLLAHMRAEHWIDDAPDGKNRYTMFGYYDDKLVKTGSGWKIAEMQLNVTRTEGDRWVMDEAMRRMRAKRG
jgi:3-phenylpropionate/cinnamic acid dioxygenase small subunit